MRKLTYAAMAYTLAIFVLHYFEFQYNLMIAAISIVALSVVSILLLRGNMRKRVLIVSLFVLLGLVRYEVHQKNTVDKFEDYLGLECRITAEVCEYPVLYDNSVKYTVKLATDLLPKTKAIIYDYTTSSSELIPGAKIRATVRLSSALFSSGEETDSYISKGVYVRGYVTDEVKILSNGYKLKYGSLYLAESIRNSISNNVSPRSAAFLSALLTGDRTSLYEDMELNHMLTRAGLSHVVAVSGMHVSFVVAFAMLLFGHRVGWVSSVILIALFAVMTGMSPSVLRAVLMQILYLLAPILRRETDGITSVCFALLIILTFNPFSISSMSLQLSFLAMIGIILVTPKAMAWFSNKNPFHHEAAVKIYRFVTASISSTLGAIIFSAPVCAYYFGSVSVLSPITNLLVLWIVPFCFIGGFILFIFDIFLPLISVFVSVIVELCVTYIFTISKWISSSLLSALYLPPESLLLWFVLVYTVIAVMFLFRKKGMYRPMIPVVVAVLSLMIISIGNDRNYDSGLTVGAVDVGQGQCITVFDGEITVMTDCGGDYDAGETAARWLYSHGRNQVDLLIISHFDEDHVNGVVDLMMQIPIKEIIYTVNNITENEMAMINRIQDYADKQHTKITLVNRPKDISLDSLTLRLFVTEGDDSNDGIIVSLQSGDYRMMIMGDADFEAENQIMWDSSVNDIDCLVIGHHGSKYSTSKEFLERTNPETAIISSGYNPYGHPSDEVIDRLTDKNVVIYRTDQVGSIEIKVR